ncbi:MULTISPECIES: hypothetical protein [Morganellaceae]|uniref:Uncharacterized protein n=3 Tax=Morganellaceae TaxID=1903414 RepID=Q8KK98_PROVU|nr:MULTISPECIES: hypothetical protein [Morganellaceae]UNH44086.1 hypothetical protein MNY66_17185 [Moellerella wisconsensis]BAB93597.1 hypothetical protein [Proteus vulgaris]
MIDPKTTKALNDLAMGAVHHEHTLLSENHHLMEIFTHLTYLKSTSEGIYLGEQRIPWRDALPNSFGVPSIEATQKEGERYLTCVSESWAARYNAKAQETLAKKIADNSTTENDNLYLLTMFYALSGLLDKLLPFIDLHNYQQFEPEGALALNEVVNGFAAVTNGVITTEKVKEDVFSAGIENAIMALNEQKHILASKGQDVSGIEQSIEIIKASQHADSPNPTPGQRIN